MPLGARSGSSGRWFAAGSLALTGFFALEAATRERGTASSLDASAEDRGTTEGIVRAYLIAGLATPVLRIVPGPRLPPSLAATGLLLQLAGIGLRAWSMRTLGRSYTRTLRTEGEQPVVADGPYGLIRHPGYLGSLLIWTGFGLTSQSVPSVVVVAAVVGDAYRRRIEAEEALLRRELPGYAAYASQTKRLLPFVW
jgi:protein-S-isoprenylcysteine O-methyltransferase